MTKQHTLAYYRDGYTRIAFCNVCSAEGVRLIEDCSKKFEKTLDEKNQTAKK